MNTFSGTTVQHYRVGERLGAGGMGEVYRAEDVRLGREVALKFLPADLKSDPESRARLLNEARAASMLRSPNIAVTYDIGESKRLGLHRHGVRRRRAPVVARRRKAPLPLREVIEIGLQVTDALDEAHSRGIVHRDVKSANLMRTERGLVKVLDFGLAKFVTPDGLESSTITQPQVTMAGMVVGTVSYMAPEQALGHAVDHRTDLFSLGVVLFELVDRRASRSSARRRPRSSIASCTRFRRLRRDIAGGDSAVVRRGAWRARSRSRRRSAISRRATCRRSAWRRPRARCGAAHVGEPPRRERRRSRRSSGRSP